MRGGVKRLVDMRRWTMRSTCPLMPTARQSAAAEKLVRTSRCFYQRAPHCGDSSDCGESCCFSTILTGFRGTGFRSFSGRLSIAAGVLMLRKRLDRRLRMLLSRVTVIRCGAARATIAG